MSHFTVMVIGNYPEAQLAPYIEQLETPEDVKNYGEFTDCTEEVLQGWEENTIECVKIAGKWVSKNEARCNARPEGTATSEVKVSDYYPDLETYVERYHGYQTNNGRYGYWSNPNAKWDWYVLGGRWEGSLKLKPGRTGTVSEPGAFGSRGVPKGYCDAALKGDIDFEGMREQAAEKANKEYTAYEKAAKHLEDQAISWPAIRGKYSQDDIQKARDEYHANPWVKAVKGADEVYLPFMGDDAYAYLYINNGGRERFVKDARDSACSMFALLKDGEWHERGSMGWWGCVSDEKASHEWNAEFSKLLDDLPDDTLLSVYDCHI